MYLKDLKLQKFNVKTTSLGNYVSVLRWRLDMKAVCRWTNYVCVRLVCRVVVR